ncbi:MAG: hypothetical protein KC550_04875 [Nanoarchaeota archaeon]|nr:hypothetical protein [Nanoarchaeota archaeon]MCP5512575.1 hypothetical protein [Leptospiraceae bacterium]
MNQSLVFELQQELYNSNSRATNILRMAYIISRKLKVDDFEKWIHLELNGYIGQVTIPEYRKVYGQVVAWNPYHSWQYIVFEQRSIQDQISNKEIIQSIPELEDLIQKSGEGLSIPLPDELSKYISYKTKISLSIDSSQLIAIIEKVKNILLEWSLKLEEDGIIGENMSFNNDEIKNAQSINYTVNNFYENINNSQIINSSTDSSINNSNISLEKLEELITTIKENIDHKDFSIKNKNYLKSEIQKIEIEKKKYNTINFIIQESLRTIRNILEGTSGSIIASGILYKYKDLFGF